MALFIFRPQLLRRFSEKEKYKTGSQLKSVCYIYDIIIFPVKFSFVLSPFQYHNALQKAQMRYRLFQNKKTQSYNSKNSTPFLVLTTS